MTELSFKSRQNITTCKHIKVSLWRENLTRYRTVIREVKRINYLLRHFQSTTYFYTQYKNSTHTVLIYSIQQYKHNIILQNVVYV